MDGLFLLAGLIMAQPAVLGESWQSLMSHDDSGALRHWRPAIEAPRLARLTPLQIEAERRALMPAMRASWRVTGGSLVHSGDGCDIETCEVYGDYRLELDWRVEPGSETALFLRGTPSLKLWDPRSRFDRDRGLGSAGLYFNRIFHAAPLVFADNKVGAWNQLQVIHVGDRVTVRLNGSTVVESVPLEPFWKNHAANPLEGPLVLKAHRGVVALKGIRIQQLKRPLPKDPETAH